jgi:hypothetical protein
MICSGCRTTNRIPEPVIVIEPPLPPVPMMEQVQFADKDGGLWLSYEQYRALERNVIALREYADRLLLLIEFYQEVQNER